MVLSLLFTFRTVGGEETPWMKSEFQASKQKQKQERLAALLDNEMQFLTDFGMKSLKAGRTVSAVFLLRTVRGN